MKDKKTTRKEFLIKAGRFTALLGLTALAGYLFTKGFSNGGLCRDYDRCASCNIKTNCSLNEKLPKTTKWKVAEKK